MENEESVVDARRVDRILQKRWKQVREKPGDSEKGRLRQVSGATGNEINTVEVAENVERW